MSEALLTAAPVAKNENILMNVVLEDAQQTAAEADSALFFGVLMMYCQNFTAFFLLYKLSGLLWICKCALEIDKDLILTSFLQCVSRAKLSNIRQ